MDPAAAIRAGVRRVGLPRQPGPGSPSFACYANNHIVSDLLVLGAPIERMLRQIDTGLVMARNLEFIDAQSILHTQARYIRRLAGDSPGSIPIPPFEELAARVAASSMGPLHFWWQLFEGLLRFLESDFEGAAAHLDQAWALTWAVPAHIHLIDLALFSVLNRAALQTASGRPQEFDQPMRHRRLWAQRTHATSPIAWPLPKQSCCACRTGSPGALQRYEEAISQAQSSVVPIRLKGLSHEMAARSYQSLGLQVSRRHTCARPVMPGGAGGRRHWLSNWKPSMRSSVSSRHQAPRPSLCQPASNST